MLAETSDRADRQQMRHAERFEGVNVGLVRQLCRRQAVPGAMPGQKDDVVPANPAQDQRITRRAVWRVDLPTLDNVQLRNIVETASTNDSEQLNPLFPPRDCTEYSDPGDQLSPPV